MDIQPLDDATLASIRQSQSHRYPQTATLHLPGDRGIGKLSVPVVIGNPSGACKMPPGSLVLPAWSQYVAHALGGGPEPEGLIDLLARDAVLWPVDTDELFGRWPAVAQPVVKVLFQKIGRMAVADPKEGEHPPEAIAAYLEGHPRATWRWMRPGRGDALSLIVEPPRADQYAIFSDEMSRPTGDHWKLVKGFVDSCVPALFTEDGLATSLDLMLARWPGAAISLAKEAAVLGGIAADAELGE